MNIEAKLEETINEQLACLDEMEAGTPEYEKLSNSVAKLTNELANIRRIAQEKQDAKNDRVVKYVDIGTKATLIGLGTYLMFKFEEHGSITSSIGRGLIKNFIPKI